MPRADWKQMQEYPVLIPPQAILHNFESLIEPILIQLKILTHTNVKLREMRDLLLPRLMNGEV